MSFTSSFFCWWQFSTKSHKYGRNRNSNRLHSVSLTAFRITTSVTPEIVRVAKHVQRDSNKRVLSDRQQTAISESTRHLTLNWMGWSSRELPLSLQSAEKKKMCAVTKLAWLMSRNIKCDRKNPGGSTHVNCERGASIVTVHYVKWTHAAR